MDADDSLKRRRGRAKGSGASDEAVLQASYVARSAADCGHGHEEKLTVKYALYAMSRASPMGLLKDEVFSFGRAGFVTGDLLDSPVGMRVA